MTKPTDAELASIRILWGILCETETRVVDVVAALYELHLVPPDAAFADDLGDTLLEWVGRGWSAPGHALDWGDLYAAACHARKQREAAQ